jgi:hypothetical protein
MIVCHSFFYKAHPKYLDNAVSMMREVNNCCFFSHDDFEAWVLELRNVLRETTGGRFEKNDIQLSRTNGTVQIDVKHGLDYAARIEYIIVEKALTRQLCSGKFVKQCGLEPSGDIVYL